MTNWELIETFKSETFNMKKELEDGLGRSLKSGIKLKEPVTINKRKNQKTGETSGDEKTKISFEDKNYSFSQIASWAVWEIADKDEHGKKLPKKLHDQTTLDYFTKDKADQLSLNPNVVFLGINAGAGAIDKATNQHRDYTDFEMFHKTYNQLQYLHLALEQSGPKLMGGYITDLFKFLPTSAAGDLSKLLAAMEDSEREALIKTNIQLLKKELSLLGPQPKWIVVLQGLGTRTVKGEKVPRTVNDTPALVYNYLRKYFFEDGYSFVPSSGSGFLVDKQKQYVVSGIPHYSMQVGTREDRINKIANALKPINAQYPQLP